MMSRSSKSHQNGAEPLHVSCMAIARLVQSLCADGAKALNKTERVLDEIKRQGNDCHGWAEGGYGWPQQKTRTGSSGIKASGRNGRNAIKNLLVNETSQ